MNKEDLINLKKYVCEKYYCYDNSTEFKSLYEIILKENTEEVVNFFINNLKDIIIKYSDNFDYSSITTVIRPLLYIKKETSFSSENILGDDVELSFEGSFFDKQKVLPLFKNNYQNQIVSFNKFVQCLDNVGFFISECNSFDALKDKIINREVDTLSISLDFNEKIKERKKL